MTPYDIQRAASWRKQSTRKLNPFLVALPYVLFLLLCFLSGSLLAHVLISLRSCPPQSTSSLL